MNWNQSSKNDFDDVLSMFDGADAETAAGAIPPGKYRARLVDGHLDRAGTGTPCFGLKWELTDGEFQGRHLVSRHWLSAKAIARTKGDLLALGIHGEHLRGACSLPAVMVELKVVHRADDDGDLYQEIKRIRPLNGDAASVNGHDGANAAGADTVQGNEADAVQAAGAAIPGDDGAAPSGDDDFMDGEYIDFSGKE